MHLSQIAKRGDFKIDDKVEHVSMGKGEVAAVDRDDITVCFESGSNGIYDDVWFKRHPNWLVKL